MNRYLILIAMLVMSTACRPKAKPVADSATTTAEAAPTPPAQADTGQRGDDAADRGPECSDDRVCDTYLRCEDGHCRVPPAVDGREVPGMPTAVFRAGQKELATIFLEIADAPHERSRGLMFRRRMHPDFGMLFVFDNDQPRSFWMKNTLIPLDMVHIDSSGRVVGVVESAEPLTLTPRETGEPARYVLELTSGRAKELGIEPGVTMTVTGLSPEQSPTGE